jgi:hypothetical protein
MGHMAYGEDKARPDVVPKRGFDPIRGDFWHQRKWSFPRRGCRELPFTSLAGGNNHHDRLERV